MREEMVNREIYKNLLKEETVIKLINWCISKYCVKQYDYNENYSLGLLSYTKALKAHDESKGKFSTLLFKTWCNDVNREIKFLNSKSQSVNQNNYSLNYQVANKDGREIEAYELIEDKNSNIEESVVDDFAVREILDKINLIPDKRISGAIIDIYFNGLNKKEVCAKHNVCHQILNTSIERFKKALKDSFDGGKFEFEKDLSYAYVDMDTVNKYKYVLKDTEYKALEMYLNDIPIKDIATKIDRVETYTKKLIYSAKTKIKREII